MVGSSGVGKRHACEEGWQNVKGAKQKEFTISFRYILLSERASTSHWSVADGEHELGSDRRKLVSIFYQWTSRCNNTSNSTSSVLSFSLRPFLLALLPLPPAHFPSVFLLHTFCTFKMSFCVHSLSLASWDLYSQIWVWIMFVWSSLWSLNSLQVADFLWPRALGDELKRKLNCTVYIEEMPGKNVSAWVLQRKN